jgi:poly(hydroxyalkanoate) depolymerase family esterase
VTSGNNGDYSAGPGWNACTGLGTPDGALLLTALISASSQPRKAREEQARQERERVFTPQILNLGQGSWQSYMYGDRLYYVYTPVNYRVGTAVPLFLVLHGCEQFPIDIAYDSRINELADQQQFVAVYPQHAELRLGDSNPMLCWNFFYEENQVRGSGEPASLAGIVQAVAQNTLQWTIDRQRIYVAGISSGGAMTVILGATYPDLFAAIGVHAGLEYQWAQLPHPIPLSQPAAVGVQVQSPVVAERANDARTFFHEGFLSVLPPGPDPSEQGQKAYEAMGSSARVVPVIVLHGTDDPVVNPINGDQVVQQWLRTNQLASHGAFTANFGQPSSVTPGQVPDGHSYTVFTWKDALGSDIVSYYKVDGMGHAWSGGSPGRPFTDPKGPGASQAIYQFFMKHTLP